VKPTLHGKVVDFIVDHKLSWSCYLQWLRSNVFETLHHQCCIHIHIIYQKWQVI